MDLSEDIDYSTVAKNEIGLINPVFNELDKQLFELATELEQLSPIQRDDIQAAMSSKTSWALVTFATRAAVFALRDEDPEKVRASFTMLAMALGRNDPRDIIIASEYILYVAAKLSVAVPTSLLDQVAKSGPHRQRMIGKCFEREAAEYLSPRGFREVQTRFGIGLVASDGGPFQPECDLLEAVIDIVEHVKTDKFYSSVSVRINSKRVHQPNRGAFLLSAIPDYDAHPDMRHQSFRMNLFEFSDEAALHQQEALHGKANSSVNLQVTHQNLLFTAVAHSFVKGVENVESIESIQRFAEPVHAILVAVTQR